MSDNGFIQVILPLRLDWNPTYVLQEGQSVRTGDRIRVNFASREYIGVVCNTGVDIRSAAGRTTAGTATLPAGTATLPAGTATPPAGIATPPAGIATLPAGTATLPAGTTTLPTGKVLPVISTEGPTPVSGDELRLWEFVSSYYMCTIGEVYRAAYPSGLVNCELKKARGEVRSTPPPAPRLNAGEKDAVREILQHFQDGRTVLLETSSRMGIYSELIRRALESGKDVLLMRPGSSPDLFGCSLKYRPETTASRRRDTARALRDCPGQFVEGGRSSVFLPFRNLGLVIVDEEHSPEYKQSSPAPRYNARDVAVVLAGIHGASVLLCSETPSLDSEYNCLTGKYDKVVSADGTLREAEVVDTGAERRKNGMIGNFSRILLGKMQRTLDSGKKVLLLQPWEDTSDAEIEARTHFPKAGGKINAMPLRRLTGPEADKYALVALLNADYLLSRDNLRADERTYQLLYELGRKCRGELLIQSSRPLALSGNCNMVESLLADRKAFNLPPFTREIDILGRKSEIIRRVFLPKDKNLQASKEKLRAEAGKFAIFDVDPK